MLQPAVRLLTSAATRRPAGTLADFADPDMCLHQVFTLYRAAKPCPLADKGEKNIQICSSFHFGLSRGERSWSPLYIGRQTLSLARQIRKKFEIFLRDDSV